MPKLSSETVTLLDGAKRVFKCALLRSSHIAGLLQRMVQSLCSQRWNSIFSVVIVWTCPALVPPCLPVYAAFWSKAKGLFRPSAEWWRFGLQNPFMYSKITLSSCRRVSHEWCQISSALGRLCASSKANINSKTGKPYDTKSFARSGHDYFTRR